MEKIKKRLKIKVLQKNKISYDVLQIIKDEIIHTIQPEKIILFGSYAYGSPDENSDIDILVIKESSKRRIERFCEVRRILRDIKGVSIQPIVLTPKEIEERVRLKDDFILEVLDKGIFLYES